MRRKASSGRRPQNAVSKQGQATGRRFRRSFEALEPRHMLSADDLLIGNYDGGGTVRYNEAADVPAAGAVAPGDNGMNVTSGIAVAPDGTFYASNLLTAQVYHYSNSGVFLGVLGASDAVQAPLEEPGNLAFGPNGNLYVADLGSGAIYQFDVNSPTQEYQSADTIALTAGYPGEVPVPGGFAFATNGDLIVGDLGDGSVGNYHNGSFTSYYINPFTTVGTNDSADTNDPYLNPSSILAENNGNLLIADIDFDGSNEHHQIVQYSASTLATTQFINLTTPLGSDHVSNTQPESMLLDQDGNLLVGVSPDHHGNGAVQKYDINSGAYISTIVSGIGTPAGLAYIPSEQSDLLVGDYDDSSVLRYTDSTSTAVPGGVPAGNPNLATVSGIAVAPDGTYYASSLLTDQVLHYSSVGVLLGALGAADAVQAPLEEPGNLAFGPDGNLYVADLGSSAIYQFNVNSPTQQYQASGTISLAAGYPGETPVPGGFAFAANGDLVVGDLGDGSVASYHDGSLTGYDIYPFTTVGVNDSADTNDPYLNPSSILVESNGNLLIADIDFDGSNEHHQIVQYNVTTQTASQFINLTTPMGSDDVSYAQPESMLLDQDGNLLVAVSPDHHHNGAIQKYDINTGALISTLISGIGTPAGLAFIEPAPILATSGGATNYTAGAGGVAADSGLQLSDVNSLPDLSATVNISGNLQVGDSLNFSSQNGITGSYNSGTGTLTLSGNASASQYQTALQSVTFSSASTSTLQRTISFAATDGTQSSVTGTKAIDVSAPITVSGVYVSGSAWTPSFLTYLGGNSLGSSTYGYALQTGGSQLNTLPFNNVNTIDVAFSGPVGGVAAGSLKLVGGSGPGAVAAPLVTGESYLGNNVYQWTLSGPLGNNKYVVAVASTGSTFGPAVVDGNSAGISGRFVTSSSSFPSGNGLAGSTFDFSFDVLPGDGNQNSSVNTVDTAVAKSLLNRRSTQSGYSPYYDYNGQGVINTIDVAIDGADVNDRQSTIAAPAAPAAATVGPASFAALALGVQESGRSSSGSSNAALSNFAPTGSVAPAAGTSNATAGGSGSSASHSGGTAAAGSRSHGRHRYAATDEAVADFDLADLWV